MTDVALALPLAEEQALAADASRHGHRVVARCSGGDELATRLPTAAAELVVSGAAPQYLSARLVDTCDRLGVRLVAVATAPAERRHAAGLGVLDVLDAPVGWETLVPTRPRAADQVDERTASRRIGATPERGTVIAVWGPAGAPGRTSIAIALAAELAARGTPVALADADTHGAAIAPALGLLDEAPGFAAACRLVATGGLDGVELDRIAQPHGSGVLRVLTGIGRASRWPELGGDRVQGVLAALRAWAPVTVVDTAASLEEDEELTSDLMDSIPDAIDGTNRSAHSKGRNGQKGPMKPRIGAYERISLDMEGEALGVARQDADIRKLAARRDWEIAEHFTDNNLSAFQRKVIRPEFERLLVALGAGELDGIAAYDLDRLARRPKDLERIIDLYEERRGLVFATVQGEIDLSTSNGRAMARVLVTMANKQSEDTSRRVKRKIQEQAENGRPHWGRPPYGYNQDGTLNPAEAPNVRQMGEWFIDGFSYREITWRLNEQGIRTRTGQLFYVSAIRKYLASERYAAIRVHDGKEYPGNWTPIFTKDEWASIRDMAQLRRNTFTGKANNRRYLMTGVLVCSCGTRLQGMTKRDSDRHGKHTLNRPLRRTYQCPTQSERERRIRSCGGTCVGSEPLEHFIKELILARLDSADLASLLGQGDEASGRLTGLLAERDQHQARRDAILDDYADGAIVSAADFKHAVARVDGRLAAIDAEIDRLRVRRFKLDLSAGETVRQAWDSRGDGWRRQLIDLLIERIVVNKSSRKPYYIMDGKRTRFDADRLDITWRV